MLRLYEPVINMRSPHASETESFSDEPLRRTEALWSALKAARDFFDAHLAIDPPALMHLPFTATAHIAFATVTTARLLLLGASTDWDPAAARRSFDFAEVVQRMADAYEASDHAAVEVGRRRRILDDGSSALLKYAFKVRWIRQWFLSRLQAEQPLPAEGTVAGVSAGALTGETVAAEDPISGLDAWGDYQFDETIWQTILALDENCPLGDQEETDMGQAMGQQPMEVRIPRSENVYPGSI
jgi:hypothetical protein